LKVFTLIKSIFKVPGFLWPQLLIRSRIFWWRPWHRHFRGWWLSATKFAWNIKTGVKINTGKAVSFKLNAYLQSVVSTFGTDYWNTWYGVVAVPDYATLLQFGLGGAICLDFPKKK
jgi:uncharacterized membrane protein